MKVLFLGYIDSLSVDFLNQTEDVVMTNNRIDSNFIIDNKIEFIVSYGYRYLIEKEILDLVSAINLHISYLPYNKGADPNFWSFVNDTPKGVTIHYVDESYDTGDIIVQEEIKFTNDETLRTSYNKLQILIQKLFKNNWDNIKNGTCNRIKQNDSGSLHLIQDKERYIKEIGSDYLDMKISILLSQLKKGIHYA